MSIIILTAVAALTTSAAPQEGAARYANWREATPCAAVFDAAANRAYAANQREPNGGHGQAFETWDGASMAMIESMNSRLSLAQSEQADRIRNDTEASLRELNDDAVYARAQECKSRLPDPIRLP